MHIRLVTMLSFLFISCSTAERDFSLYMDEKQWQEDLTYLENKVSDIVPNYDDHKTWFRSEYQNLLTSGKNGYDMVLGIQRLMNTLNDEGCAVPFFQKGLELEVLPIKTQWFSEGLYILDASDHHQDVINQQIIKVNNIAIEEVYQKLKNYLNADNEHYKRHLFQMYAFVPRLLKVADLGTSDNHIELEFASGKTKVIASAVISEYSKLDRSLPNDELFTQLNKSHKGENYWLEMVPNSKTLFVQLQEVANNDKGDSFSKFVGNIKSLVNAEKVDKLIIDVRYGGGGNGFKLKKLTDFLKESDKVNIKGGLFVLTSKATKGTLLELASILRLNTKAIIVGEATGEGPNTVGDIKYITLPNSGLKVSVIHTYWPTSWRTDNSKTIIPDLPIRYPYTDKARNVDTWLETIKKYQSRSTEKQVPKELMDKLVGTYRTDGRKIRIKKQGDRLHLTMSRRMRSLFEINTELYVASDGLLATDMKDVFLEYSDTSGFLTLHSIKWGSHQLKID